MANVAGAPKVKATVRVALVSPEEVAVMVYVLPAVPRRVASVNVATPPAGVRITDPPRRPLPPTAIVIALPKLVTVLPSPSTAAT